MKSLGQRKKTEAVLGTTTRSVCLMDAIKPHKDSSFSFGYLQLIIHKILQFPRMFFYLLFTAFCKTLLATEKNGFILHKGDLVLKILYYFLCRTEKK